MAELLRCDHCQKTVEAIYASTWWQVGSRAHMGMGAMFSSAVQQGPNTLCSTECLMGWVRARQEQEAEAEVAEPTKA